jgi:radical SAM enzyme (TIGR01210 family)
MEIKNDKPIRMWQGTLILQCPPCGWGKCVFCGYSGECITTVQPSTDAFLKQLNYYLDKYDTKRYIEIYNSGSFLDNRQISPKSRVAIFRHLAKKKIKGITIESRPEYITKEKIEALMQEFKGELTVAMGLEVADDSVLKMLNKGFTLKDIEKAYLILDGMGIFSRVYILVGPPFVKDPKTSALKSVKYAKKIGFTETFLLGAYPMKKSPAYELWKKGDWLPLRKDDFDEIIRLAQDIKPDIEFSSDGLEEFWRLRR